MPMFLENEMGLFIMLNIFAWFGLPAIFILIGNYFDIT